MESTLEQYYMGVINTQQRQINKLQEQNDELQSQHSQVKNQLEDANKLIEDLREQLQMQILRGTHGTATTMDEVGIRNLEAEESTPPTILRRWDEQQDTESRRARGTGANKIVEDILKKGIQTMVRGLDNLQQFKGSYADESGSRVAQVSSRKSILKRLTPGTNKNRVIQKKNSNTFIEAPSSFQSQTLAPIRSPKLRGKSARKSSRAKSSVGSSKPRISKPRRASAPSPDITATNPSFDFAEEEGSIIPVAKNDSFNLNFDPIAGTCEVLLNKKRQRRPRRGKKEEDIVFVHEKKSKPPTRSVFSEALSNYNYPVMQSQTIATMQMQDVKIEMETPDSDVEVLGMFETPTPMSNFIAMSSQVDRLASQRSRGVTMFQSQMNVSNSRSLESMYPIHNEGRKSRKSNTIVEPNYVPRLVLVNSDAVPSMSNAYLNSESGENVEKLRKFKILIKPNSVGSNQSATEDPGFFPSQIFRGSSTPSVFNQTQVTSESMLGRRRSMCLIREDLLDDGDPLKEVYSQKTC